MSTRRATTRFTIAIASAILMAGGAGFAISACSSTPSETDAPDATPEAAVDAHPMTVDTGPDEIPDSAPKQTPEQCEAACKTAHPLSVPKEKAIDDCWAAYCMGPCVDVPPTGFDAGDPEAGIDGGDGGADLDASNLCGTMIPTGNMTCSNCTQEYCCPSWADCFNDIDCRTLDKCINNCFGP